MSDTTDFPKGSEWRKWDLHIHSPASLLNNQFPKLHDGSPDWEAYINKLEECDLAVVGITDYFTIEGYKQVLEYKKQGRLANINTVLPNIEFRLNSVISSKKDGKEPRRLNFHVIFSDDVSPSDVEEHFLHDLHFYYQGNPQDKDDRRKLKVSNIEALGKELISQHKAFQDGRSAGEIGAMNIVVSHEEITEILTGDKRFKDKYIIVFPEELFYLIDWDGQDHHLRKSILQKSDMVFSSNPKTKTWCLGVSPYTEGQKKFIEEFKTLKPCIHGCDAHSLDRINAPCSLRGNDTHDCQKASDKCDMRYCWIKADPTFEGLKQVLYEPVERVITQDTNPTPVKTGFLLDNLEIPETKINDELTLGKKKIEFNSNLIVVTGGKGTGKTANVDLVANHFIDRVNTKDKNSFVKRIAQPDLNLTTSLTLRNGQTFSKKLTEAKFIENSRLAYISQGELEEYISDSSELNTYINNLIFASKNIADSVKQYEYNNLETKIVSLAESVRIKSISIEKLEQETRDEAIKLSKTKEVQVKAELKDVEQKILEIEKGLNADKVKLARKKQNVISQLKNKRDLYISIKNKLAQASQFIQTDVVQFNQLIVQTNVLLSKLDAKDQLGLLEYEGFNTIQEKIKSLDKGITEVITAIEKSQKELQQYESEVQEHAKLLDKKREFSINFEKAKEANKNIESKKEELKTSMKDRKKLFTDYLNTVIDLKEKYAEIITIFSQDKAEVLSDLNFEAQVTFNESTFKARAEELLDNRKVDDVANLLTEIINIYGQVTSGDRTKITELVDKVEIQNVSLKVQLKPSHLVTALKFYEFLFGHYLSVIPLVKYHNVNLSKLSLGQKATVLIKIYLAWGDEPIIIDSHDDHLDNAYIMEELIGSIRHAKKYRQVILVSNNGNVVINSDAEQIILAERDNNSRITYISGSIENPIIRDKALIVLEGGYDAFKRRQQKYRINI